MPNTPDGPVASCAGGVEPAPGRPGTSDPPRGLRPAVVVLAAGASRRLGQPKQLLTWQGEALIVKAVRLALAAGGPVHVVLGAHAAACEAVLAASGLPACRVVQHAAWEEGMGRSLAAGVSSLSPEVAAVLVLLVDQPRIEAGDLHSLVMAWQAAPTRVAASRYAGCLGVPAIFPASHFGRLRALRGATGARALIAEAAEPSVVDVPAAAFDIDEPADLAAPGVPSGTGGRG